MEWKGGVGNGCVCIDSERDAILIFLIYYFPSSKRIGIKTKMHKIFQVQSFVPKISEFATLGVGGVGRGRALRLSGGRWRDGDPSSHLSCNNVQHLAKL